MVLIPSGSLGVLQPHSDSYQHAAKCERPDTQVANCTGYMGDTSSLNGEEAMPWRECSVMDERLQFVAHRLAGKAMAEL